MDAVTLSDNFQRLHAWLSAQIIGQPALVERLLVALLADGHLLVEGAPGLAKTRAINSLSKGLEADFQRIQFTPDLLPADITGSDIFHQEDASFSFQQGPIFHNLVLADEINRAPAKVQSALLEAMAERQISVGQNTFPLPDVFMVMATQNPLEQEGTYPLPEAQLDRFLMKVLVAYPDAVAERAILRLNRQEAGGASDNGMAEPPQLTQTDILAARKAILNIHMAEPVEEYIVQLSIATRQPYLYDARLAGWLEVGVSPRASIALDRCSRAHAWLAGRDFVTPEDVQQVLHDVYRHRLILSFEAEANGIDADQVIDALLSVVPVG
ncbi:AAA family ATPase [Aliamphritea hakodatensis]|uniref:AAA family ATPase n=1 Tax=Aliamphritea hakodatensis TaxID=2895352 RepID=UPI0022FDA98D|nr:MoxR family ATPase [Aliamphritea hakodatensis]